MVIKFGTDGWRAVTGNGFTMKNVRIVAQAIADCILAAEKDAVIAVGYDTRFMSDVFARECALVLAANGIKVLLSETVTPTPVLSHLVKYRQATGGIVFTASHNPYQYNGIKYKAGYGGPALPGIICGIEDRLYCSEPKTVDFDEVRKTGLIECLNGEWDYICQLRSLVDIDKINTSLPKVIIDPMHGAGAGLIPKILGAGGTQIREIRANRDVLFGGVNPEPISHNLQVLSQVVREVKAQAGLATDGDADRIGAVDANGEFVNAHSIFALILRYLVKKRGLSGGVAKTFSTSRMIDKLAAKHNLPVTETPIGFKYICELFLSEDILIGGEESGGIGFKNHIPERDGILCILLVMEIMAEYKITLNELVNELMQEIGYHYYDRADLHLAAGNQRTRLQEMLTNGPPDFAGMKVEEVLTLDGTKLVFGDGSWILFRASGTEPVIRVYTEADSPEKVDKLLQAGVDFVNKVLID